MDTSKIIARSCQKARRLQGAFSLVEVTLAIGIIAFAFIGVFGLIPTGLNTFHQAVDASVGSQIAQKVINEAQQTDFDTLVDSTNLPNYPAAPPTNYTFQGPAVNNPSLRYFDDQGNELSGADISRTIYQVRTRIMPATLAPCSGASQTVNSLATVTIQIANNPSNQAIAVDANTNLWSDTRIPITVFSTLVSRNK